MEFKAKKDGKEYGPYSLDEIYALVKSGEFKETDLTWNSITKQWQIVGEAIPMEKQNILVHKNGHQYGPFSHSELFALIEVGDYNRDTDLAWQEGMTEWRPLGEIIPPDDTDEIIKMYSDGETEEDIIKIFSDDPTEEPEVTTPALPQTTNKEDQVIELIGSAIGLIYQTYFRLLGQVVRQLVEDMESEKVSVSKKQKLLTQNITKLYSVFFGVTEWLEADGMESLAKTISNETLRDEIKEMPYNLIASDLRNSGLDSFISLRDRLQETMSSLGVQHESISVTQSAATGAVAGAAIGYLATKGKSEGKAAVVGAIIGAGSSVRQRQAIRGEMYTHGLGSCMELLKGLHKLTNTLFDQTILLCLPKRPLKNPRYVSFIEQLDDVLKSKLVNEGVFVMGFFSILSNQLEAARKVRAAKTKFGLALGLFVLVVALSFTGEATPLCVILAIVLIFPAVGSCIEINRQSQASSGIDETMKQFRRFLDTTDSLVRSS